MPSESTAPSLSRIRIVQVSDCHVSADRNARYRGLNADRELARLMPVVRGWQPDIVLLTGDVAEDASAAAYGRVHAALHSLGAPLLALPGNHDEIQLMQRYFPLGPWGSALFHRARNWQIVLLDSTAPGKVPGYFSAEQLESLENGLKRSNAAHVLVALHHQPVAVGSPWIDKYALMHHEALFAVLDSHPEIRCVTWGHIHQAFESTRKGVQLLGSPSSVANSLPGREKFTLDASGPACRWFELSPDGSFETGLLRAGYA